MLFYMMTKNGMTFLNTWFWFGVVESRGIEENAAVFIQICKSRGEWNLVKWTEKLKNVFYKSNNRQYNQSIKVFSGAPFKNIVS